MEKHLHQASINLARRLVDIVSVCLRPEERQDALLEFYRTVREGLDAFVADSRLRDETPGEH